MLAAAPRTTVPSPVIALSPEPYHRFEVCCGLYSRQAPSAACRHIALETDGVLNNDWDLRSRCPRGCLSRRRVRAGHGVQQKTHTTTAVKQIPERKKNSSARSHLSTCLPAHLPVLVRGTLGVIQRCCHYRCLLFLFLFYFYVLVFVIAGRFFCRDRSEKKKLAGPVVLFFFPEIFGRRSYNRGCRVHHTE